MTCKPAREALLRRGGHGQKRVSNGVGRPCSTRKRVLRVVCAGSTSAPRARRATMKSGDRDLKRATRACGFGLEVLSPSWARFEERFTSSLGGNISGTQRRGLRKSS